MKTLVQLRQEIDTIDEKIIKLSVKRLIVVKKIGKVKIQAGAPIIDHKRKQQALEHRLNYGKRLGLSNNFVSKIYSLLHEEAVKIERKHEK